MSDGPAVSRLICLRARLCIVKLPGQASFRPNSRSLHREGGEASSQFRHYPEPKPVKLGAISYRRPQRRLSWARDRLLGYMICCHWCPLYGEVAVLAEVKVMDWRRLGRIADDAS